VRNNIAELGRERSEKSPSVAILFPTVMSYDIDWKNLK